MKYALLLLALVGCASEPKLTEQQLIMDKQIQQHFPDAKHHLSFFKEHGDACVQYVIRGKDTMKYDFTQHQQFQL